MNDRPNGAIVTFPFTCKTKGIPMADFFMTILKSFARGFGFRFGSDAAREVEKIVTDEISDRS